VKLWILASVLTWFSLVLINSTGFSARIFMPVKERELFRLRVLDVDLQEFRFTRVAMANDFLRLASESPDIRYTDIGGAVQ